MISRNFLVRGAAAGAFAMVLGGCAQLGMGGMETYHATLSAGQEVPQNPSRGTGNAEVVVNPSTLAMTYRVTYSGLTGPATMGHIHGPAPAGQNAGVKVPFPNAQSPITGSGTLTPEQHADLKRGLYYVNIHTAAHPGGEIRGQLTR